MFAEGFLFILSLADAAGECGALGNDPAVFFGVQDDVKHHGLVPQKSLCCILAAYPIRSQLPTAGCIQAYYYRTFRLIKL
jgi:hypothetical protein